MSDNLTGLFISDTYQRLLILSEDGSYITDGTGSIVSSLPITASQVPSPEKRHDYNDPYSYCGVAPSGSLEEDNSWSITRIFIYSDGSTLLTSASMVDWTNRYTHVYT